MSNSGGITPPFPGTTKPSAPTGQVVQIQTLPDALKTVSRSLRVEGEVVQQNRDGSVRIRTPQGDVDVTVRGRQPQQGQKLEVDIPAGSPPRTATIRNAPPAPAQPHQPPQTQPPVQTAPPPSSPLPLPQTPVVKPAPQPLPPAGQNPLPAPTPTTQPPTTTPPTTGGTQQPNLPPAPPPGSGTVPATSASAPLAGQTALQSPVTGSAEKPQIPLPASYQPTAQAMAKQGSLSQQPLSSGQIVRLTPVVAGQQILPSPLGAISSGNSEQILTSQLGRINFQADLIAQASKNTLSKTLIQTLKPSMGAPSAVSQIAPALSSPIKNSAPSALLPNVRSIANLLQPLSGAIGQTQTPPLQNLGSARASFLDAKVIEVKPLQVQISSIDGKPIGMQNTNNVPSFAKGPSDISTSITTAKPNNIVATVTGFTPQNLPVISLPLPGTSGVQNFVLQFNAGNLSQGSQIILSPQPSVPASAATGLPALKPILSLLQASPLWPAMDDLLQTFQSAPQAAQSLGRIIPSPANTGNLGPAAMLFIAAAKAGELQNWMGEKRMEFLQKIGKTSLMSRLTGETSSLSTPATDNTGNEWRSYPIPLLWQNEISKVLLHMKHETPEQEKNGQEGSTRFIFDLDLTRMGGVQIDGLLRGKRLDLIIRTHMPVSNSMQQAMKVAYANALDGTDIFGDIAFQGDLKNWMNVVKREETTLGVSA